MTCDELRPDYDTFAMGALDGPELDELRVHIARACPTCTAGTRDARAFVSSLGASAEGAAPPARLRRRILASVGAAPRERWNLWVTWGAVAVAALVMAIHLKIGFQHHAEMDALRAQLDTRTAEAAGLRHAIDLLRAPDTREVTFGAGKPEPPTGRVYVNPSGVLLIASRLPSPPAGKAYEMWVIPKAGKPAPAGMFASGGDGSAIHYHRAAIDVEKTAAIAVTLEAAGGVAAPTSQPVIVAGM